jgi:hypothetical protein
MFCSGIGEGAAKKTSQRNNSKSNSIKSICALHQKAALTLTQSKEHLPKAILLQIRRLTRTVKLLIKSYIGLSFQGQTVNILSFFLFGQLCEGQALSH